MEVTKRLHLPPRDRSSVAIRLIAYLVRAVAFDINGALRASVAKTCRSRTLDRHRRSLPQTTEGKAAAGDQPSLLRAGQLAEGIMP
jgi:hypothetical protein